MFEKSSPFTYPMEIQYSYLKEKILYFLPTYAPKILKIVDVFVRRVAFRTLLSRQTSCPHIFVFWRVCATFLPEKNAGCDSNGCYNYS